MRFRLSSGELPPIWSGDGDTLRPRVRAKLLEVVDDFITFVEDDIGGRPDVRDILLVGSSAGYTWRPDSDIDVHIVVDPESVDENTDLVRAYFDLRRRVWNSMFDPHVAGHPVEVYVEFPDDPRPPTGGVYSLLDDRWVGRPTRATADVDVDEVKHVLSSWTSMLSAAHGDEGALRSALATIHTSRGTGLKRAGEFSPENVAYRALRSSGALKRAYDELSKLHGERLSLDDDV